MDITREDIRAAIDSAVRRREHRADVVRLRRHEDAYVEAFSAMLKAGGWNRHLRYRQLERTNNNGKLRHINSPDLTTLILQHLSIRLVWPLYTPHDQYIGLNCKPGCGITASVRRFSVVKRMKHIYYDRRDLHYAVCIDQRQCYDHVTRKMLRKALKRLTPDRQLVDFAVDVTFLNNTFPVGTPTSPIMHHILMLPFEKWLQGVCPMAIRYADDVFMPFATKEEAKQALWRVKMFWWYEYQLRAKSYTQRVVSLLSENDFCGYVTKRNANKTKGSHDKGTVKLRHSIYRSAMECTSNESYASYFGLLKCADLYGTLKRIESSNMNLKQLTEKVRIDRPLDAEEISLDELVVRKIRFTIYDYDLRRDARGRHNWIKCLIGIPECDTDTGELTGNILARSFVTSAQYIVKFHSDCEAIYTKENLLPMTDMLLQKHSGYIYEGSTNVMAFIPSDYQPKLN